MSDVKTSLNAFGLTTRTLEQYAGRVTSPEYTVREHELPKRGGGTRTIYVPSAEFDTVLKLIKRALEESLLFKHQSCVHGYVGGRGIVTNASQHLGAPAVLAVDLKDFFESIQSSAIQCALLKAGVPQSHLQSLTSLAAPMGFLPAGFATSPYISNLVFDDTDRAILELATSKRLTYTRYADDLAFSGELDDEFLKFLEAVLTEHGWQLSKKKTRFMRRGGPQYVTGLYVGDPRMPHIPRVTKRRVQQELYYMATYGIEDCYRRGKGMHQRQAEGWVRYISQVEPRWGTRLRALLESIDFSDEHLYWSNPESWSGILEEIGI